MSTGLTFLTNSDIFNKYYLYEASNVVGGQSTNDYPNIYYLECKSHKGSSFPFSALSQYDKLIKKVGIKGVRAGVALWLIDLSEVYYLPISTVTKILDSGIKSFNPKRLDPEQYPFYVVPGQLKRVFKQCDWSFLSDTKEGE